MNDRILSTAVVEGAHRYALTRKWGPDNMLDADVLPWCMLNPSTADMYVTDPTLTRTVNFSKAFGYGGLELVNLFSWRSKNPADVVANLADAANQTTDRYIAAAIRNRRKIVVGWGAHGDKPWVKERVNDVVRILKHLGVEMYCVGKTKSGCPRHPLYVRASAELVRWEPVP